MDCKRIELFQILVKHFSVELEKALDEYTTLIFKNEPNANETPLIIKLPIDYDEWIKTKELRPILNEILDEPFQSQKDIQTATWITIGSLLMQKYPLLPVFPQHNQVHCIIRCSNLPLVDEFYYNPFRCPVRLSLSVMKCVLHSFSDRFLYVRQSIWYCAKQCSQNQNHIFDGEYSTAKCSECNTNLVEYEDRRSTYTCRRIQVFNATCLETPIQYGQIHRAVKVKLTDDLCNVNLILSQIYLLTGSYDTFKKTFIAWNFQPFDP